MLSKGKSRAGTRKQRSRIEGLGDTTLQVVNRWAIILNAFTKAKRRSIFRIFSGGVC